MTKNEIVNNIINNRNYKSCLIITNYCNDDCNINCEYVDVLCCDDDKYNRQQLYNHFYKINNDMNFLLMSFNMFNDCVKRKYDIIILDVHPLNYNEFDVILYNIMSSYLKSTGCVVTNGILPDEEYKQQSSHYGDLWKSFRKMIDDKKYNIKVVDYDDGVGIIEYSDDVQEHYINQDIKLEYCDFNKMNMNLIYDYRKIF